MSPQDLAAPLFRKLEAIATVPDDDKALLRKLRIATKHLGPGDNLVVAGDKPQFSALLISGMLCRYDVVASGARQIMSFHLPGDIPDLQSVFLRTMDHSVAAIGPATVGLIPHEDLHHVFERSFHLASVMWRETLIDSAIFRQWIGNIGGRTAIVAMAHLLCELVARGLSVGLIDDDMKFKLPLTQQDLADALGLSLVHINRTLRQLRRAGLITWEPGLLTVLDWPGLQAAGDFDPAYLHLIKR